MSAIGPADPLPIEAVHALRAILRKEEKWRDLALFCVGIDTFLRSCDLVALRVSDVMDGQRIRDKLTIRQKKTRKLVKCLLLKEAKSALKMYSTEVQLAADGYLFPGYSGQHITTRYHRWLMDGWKAQLRWSGFKLSDGNFSTHSIRKGKAMYLYEKTGNILAVMHLLGQSDPKVTLRYLGQNIKKAHELAAKYQF